MTPPVLVEVDEEFSIREVRLVLFAPVPRQRLLERQGIDPVLVLLVFQSVPILDDDEAERKTLLHVKGARTATYDKPSSMNLQISGCMENSWKSGLSGFLLMSTNCQGAMFPKRMQLRTSTLYWSRCGQSCFNQRMAAMNTSISLKGEEYFEDRHH